MGKLCTFLSILLSFEPKTALKKCGLNKKVMNYWYIQQMDEYQNSYAEWKKVDPQKEYILYDSI